MQTELQLLCVPDMDVTRENYAGLKQQGYIDHPIQCGVPGLAVTFFVVFTLTVSFIVLNLFIAVIFEGFEESRQMQVTNVIQLCMDRWRVFDPEYTLIVPVDDALTFITEVLERTEQGRKDPHFSKYTKLADKKMWVMRTFHIKVTHSGETHFIWCCQAILRKMII